MTVGFSHISHYSFRRLDASFWVYCIQILKFSKLANTHSLHASAELSGCPLFIPRLGVCGEPSHSFFNVCRCRFAFCLLSTPPSKYQGHIERPREARERTRRNKTNKREPCRATSGASKVEKRRYSRNMSMCRCKRMPHAAILYSVLRTCIVFVTGCISFASHLVKSPCSVEGAF